MVFNVIMEHFMTGKITFTTIVGLKDISDCIDHIHKHYPNQTIEQIKEVK